MEGRCSGGRGGGIGLIDGLVCRGCGGCEVVEERV